MGKKRVSFYKVNGAGAPAACFTSGGFATFRGQIQQVNKSSLTPERRGNPCVRRRPCEQALRFGLAEPEHRRGGSVGRKAARSAHTHTVRRSYPGLRKSRVDDVVVAPVPVDEPLEIIPSCRHGLVRKQELTVYP